MAPGLPLYNSPFVVRISGSLDSGALREAYAQVIERHEALRTTFAREDDGLVQIVDEHPSIRFRTADVTSCPCESRRDRAWDVALEDVREPFDLATGPLVRALLIRLDACEHVLALTFHHAVIDGWSVRQVLAEMSRLYEAAVANAPANLAPVALHYPDFSAWQREWLTGDVLESHLGFWRDVLMGAAVAELPADRARPRERRFGGAISTFAIDADLVARLTERARADGASLFMVLAAALDVLVYRWSGMTDVSIGAPVADRRRAELEQTVGYFANTIVLRTECGGNPSFRELLRRVRDGALQAYDHQEAPFHKVVEAVRPTRDPSRHALFQIMLALQPALESQFALGDARVEALPIDTGMSTFDLALELQETPNGLRGTAGYSTELFDAHTVARLLASFDTILRAIADDPGQGVDDMPILDDANARALLCAAHGPRVDATWEPLVHAQFESQALRTPTRRAVSDSSGSLTYADVLARVRALAGRLRSLGVGPDVPVAICLERSSNVVVSMLAVLEAGGCFLPLDPAYPAARLAAMLEDAGARAVIATRSTASRLPPNAPRCVNLDARPRRVRRPEASRRAPPADGSSLAYIIYTSGSTGEPKGVMVEHRNLTNFFAAYDAAMGQDTASTWLAPNSPSFDMSIVELLWPLVRGDAVHVYDGTPGDPSLLGAALVEQGITTLQCTPSLAAVLAAHPVSASALASIDRMIVGGEALAPALGEHLLRLIGGGRLYNGYGPTEGTICATAHRVRADEVVIPIGRPLANTRCYVLDARRRLVPALTPGELYIGGAGVARGYRNKPELTAQRFVDDPFMSGGRLYRTGDLARVRPDGTLEYLGRADEQVKIRGYRVEPGEIESAMRASPGVAEAVVIAREDEAGDRRLVGYLVGAGSAHPDPQVVLARLAARLPGHMVPSAIVPLPALPRLPNGKVDRRSLPCPGAEPAPAAPRALPSDTLEIQLVVLWERLLGRAPIGVRDNFFDLGGHSLLAARLMIEIEHRYGKTLPLVTLFRAPTIELLARALRDKGYVPPNAALVSMCDDGRSPPLVLVHRAGGHLLVYRSLVLAMGSGRQIYGAQAPGHETMSPVHDRVEDMAAHYVEQLRALHPEGGFHIAGSSFGGIVAFEMARQLAAGGDRVGRVMLFDTYPADVARSLATTPPKPNERVGARWRSRARRVAAMSAGDRVKYLRRGIGRGTRSALQWVGVLPPDPADQGRPEPPDSPRLNRVVATFLRAQAMYDMQPYPGRLTLLRAVDSKNYPGVPPDLGWSRWAAEVEIVDVPGAHLSMMEPPHVQTLAARVAELCNDAGGAASEVHCQE